MPANWKTTTLGVAAVLTAGGHLLYLLANGDPSSLMQDGGTIFAGLIGIWAKDHNVIGGTVKQ